MKYKVTLKYTFVSIVDIEPEEQEGYTEKLHLDPTAFAKWIIQEEAKLRALDVFLDTEPDFVTVEVEDDAKAQASS